mgnify:CR=1 FL=1
MLKILIPAVAALGLVAHAAQSHTAGDSAPVVPVKTVAATPVDVAPVMDWHFHNDGDTAKLAYGIANSDQLVMMLTCEAGKDTIATLGSVRAIARTAANETSYEDPMTGSVLHESDINSDDAAMTELAETGSMRVFSARGQVALGSDAADTSAVKAFFAYCGSAAA